MPEAKTAPGSPVSNAHDVYSKQIRIRRDTYDQLERLRFAGESADLLIRRLLDHWRRNHPYASPRKGGQS